MRFVVGRNMCNDVTCYQTTTLFWWYRYGKSTYLKLQLFSSVTTSGVTICVRYSRASSVEKHSILTNNNILRNITDTFKWYLYSPRATQGNLASVIHF